MAAKCQAWECACVETQRYTIVDRYESPKKQKIMSLNLCEKHHAEKLVENQRKGLELFKYGEW